MTRIRLESPSLSGGWRRLDVGTNQIGKGPHADAPSKVFAFSETGEPLRESVIEGQPLQEHHGIEGLVFDKAGLLYALDRSATARVLTIDPATGEQRTYATFRDVAPCGTGARWRATCSDAG